jgi:quercetin dioxygenase-like cupin family protein
MDMTKEFLLFDLKTMLLHDHDDGSYRTLVYGFTPHQTLELPEGFTHLGVVVEGKIHLSYERRDRELLEGDYFSIIGPATIRSEGSGMVSSAFQYTGVNAFGGPIEHTGRLRYIDGCSDSLLIPPLRKGDPCLNYLHFPIQITQTPHTHPSVRTGIVLRGHGECIIPDAPPIPLRPMAAFVIPTNTVHSFNTTSEIMDVIAFHPDSDAGMTDDDHPMINRTIVQGVSARYIPDIRTVMAK